MASVVATKKFISKHQKENQAAEENRKTLHKCLFKILNRKHRTHHQPLKTEEQKAQGEVSYIKCNLDNKVLELIKFFTSLSRILMTFTLHQEFMKNLETVARNL